MQMGLAWDSEFRNSSNYGIGSNLIYEIINTSIAHQCISK